MEVSQQQQQLQNEELIVLFHAALLGRTDVIQNAIATIRGTGEEKLSDEEVANIISTGRSEDNATPLHIATAYGHKDVIRALLNAGADLSIIASSGEYQQKRPYEVTDSNEIQNIFHVYMFERLALNDAEAMERLIDGGVPVDWSDDSAARNTTLHWACSFNNVDVAEILISHGCPVDILNNVSRTPLHLACKDLHIEIIQLLLDEGANPNVTDIDGKTPMDLIPTTVAAVVKKENNIISDDNNNEIITEESVCDKIKALLSTPPEHPSRRCYEKYLQRQHEKEEQEVVSKEEHEAQIQYEIDELETIHRHELLYSKEDLNILEVKTSDSFNKQSESEDTYKIQSHKNVLLIFWPPVKQQSCADHLPPLLLSSDENLLICVGSIDIDIFPLLTWSGLMDVMDVFGFQVQVKRSSLGARLRLGIDTNLCPGRHSYTLDVGRNQILLLASDTTALLYGVYTLIQLLQLHCDVQNKNGVTTVTVPPVTIRDSPDIPDRAVLWSYRESVRCSSTRMRSHIELLSRFRINKLLLLVNASGPMKGEGISDDSPHLYNGKGQNLSSMSKDDNATATKVYALDEVCRRHCVQMVPTIIIDSIHARLSLDVLKNFSSSVISLIFAFNPKHVAEELMSVAKAADEEESVDSEKEYPILSGETPSKSELAAAVKETCDRIFKDVHLSGATSVTFSCSTWTSSVADPASLASNNGLNACESAFSTAYPSTLFSKPIVSTQAYIDSIHKYISKVLSTGSSIATFPAVMDRDFFYPVLFVKYYCFFFGGFAWNGASILDMLGNPSDSKAFNPRIIREVLCLIMFNTKADIQQDAFKAIMQLMTGNLLAADINMEGSVASSQDTTSYTDLARAERMMWSLVTASDATMAVAVPNRHLAAECMKYYRRILHISQWKPDTLADKQNSDEAMLSFVGMGLGQNDNFSRSLDDKLNDGETAATVGMLESASQTALEVDELFCVINLLSIVGKALVWSYKAKQKQLLQLHAKKEVKSSQETEINRSHESISFKELALHLTVGNKSDLANSILGSLGSCTFLWRRRFDRGLMRSFRQSNQLAANNTNGSAEKAEEIETRLSSSITVEELEIQTLHFTASNFMLQSYPSVPCAAVFKLLSEDLTLPQNVQDFITRLFSR